MTKYTLIKSLSLSTAVAIMTTGCFFNNNKEDLLTQKDNMIAKLQHQLDAKVPMQSNKKVTSSSKEISLVPQNAKPGECYAKVLVPAMYKTETKQRLSEDTKSNIEVIPATYKVVDKKVILRAASTKMEVIPAVYKTVEEQIMVKPETTMQVNVPATYKNITEEIMIEPEKTELVPVEAVYNNVEERILVTPAHTKWKKGRGEIEKINNSTGEIMCLVDVPAVYNTVTKKVLVEKAHTKEVTTPAIYKTINSNVIDVASHTKEITTPAVYNTIEKTVLETPEQVIETKIPAICKVVKTKVVDTPASQKLIETPAVYENYETSVKTDDSYLRWQSILCETNTKPDIINNLQKALRTQGYAAPINGTYDAHTKKIVNEYQRDNKLSQGALTLKTLESLGLN